MGEACSSGNDGGVWRVGEDMDIYRTLLVRDFCAFVRIHALT